jgi:alpha-tubulin suppressor-like RCC1 family protein
LGDGTSGTTTSKSTPIEILTTNIGTSLPITAIAAGSNHSLFLRSDGKVFACGYNAYGQLGDGTTTNSSTPILISTLNNITAISTAGEHSLFLKSDGRVFACGWNLFGQLGEGTTTQRNTPTLISTLNNITAISAGARNSLFLKSNATVFACGYNEFGQLGNGSSYQSAPFTPTSTPVQCSISNVKAISSGGNSTSFFLTNAGLVYSCGLNHTEGQLGIGITTSGSFKATPVLISRINIGTSLAITAIDTGTFHSLFLRSDGKVYACGSNNSGQLGDGTLTMRTVPVIVNIDARSSSSIVSNVIYSNSLNQLKISSIRADEEYLKKIMNNNNFNIYSQAIIISEGVDKDNNIILNIGSKGIKYKKLKIYLSYLTSSQIDISNIIQNIKIEYTTSGSAKRQLLNRNDNYTIINIITDSLQFQKTTTFDIVFKSKIRMDKIFMFLPKDKFYFLNYRHYPQALNDYSTYLSNKVNEFELKNDIDKLFELDIISKRINDFKINRIYAITNEKNRIEVKNNPDSNNSITLLQNAYNKILDYDVQNKKATVEFKKADIVKVFGDKAEDSISNIKSKYISYESPNPRISSSVEQIYNIDKVAENYIYFTINSN